MRISIWIMGNYSVVGKLRTRSHSETSLNIAHNPAFERSEAMIAEWLSRKAPKIDYIKMLRDSLKIKNK